MKSKTTIVKTTRDGRLFRQTENGWEEVAVPMPTSDHDSDEPAYDRDNPPTTPEDFARMKRVPRVKTLRRVLELSQEEFAERYHIPIAVIRAWEEGRSEPDAPARAYLRIISADPEGVAEKLDRKRALNVVSS